MATSAHALPATPGTTNVDNLGYFLDGWADLIEDQGDKAQETRQLVYQFLKERNMPDITVSQKEGVVGSSSAKRPYNIISTHPGATTAIYVGQHGTDLYVSWRTYRRRILHGRVYLAFIVSALIGLLFAYPFYRGLTSGLALFTPYSLLSRYNALNSACGVWLGVVLVFFLFQLFVMIMWGHYIKHDAHALVYVQPNLFDTDDITAMSLSAHKSITRALDTTGIAIEKLRLKQTFKSGRAEELL